MGRPLWSPPPGKLDKPALPTRCDPATTASILPVSISHTTNPSRSTPSTWAPDYSPSSSSSSSSTSESPSLRHSRLTDDDQRIRRTLAARGNDNLVMRSDSSLLTLDEFLRETSAAAATRDEAERHLNNLLTLRRRLSSSGAEWAPDSPADPPMSSAASWRALVEHTPAGRARILGAGLGVGLTTSIVPSPTAYTGVAVGVRPSPYTYTPPVPPAPAPPAPVPAPPVQDSFDTLVGQIRRIGALQDFMLSSVNETDVTTTSSTPTTTTTTTTTTTAAVPADTDEGERNAVAALRVREARLRAMQTRIDLLASEFALLRNTRRELRRVEAEALSTLQTATIRNTAAVSALAVVPTVAVTVTVTGVGVGERTVGERYGSGGRRTGAVRQEWGRQGSGNRDGDGEAGVRWTTVERDRALRREVVRMQIERLPAGGVGGL